MEQNDKLIMELSLNDENFTFLSSIEAATIEANKELSDINDLIEENEKALKDLTPECDKTDYILALASGAFSGVIDIFLVGKPNDSHLQNIADKWYKNKVTEFAKLTGWNKNSKKTPIKYLEDMFKVPYDQNGIGESGKDVKGLSPNNHHFNSLGHNPSILGLFFSILDQFGDDGRITSHFISDGNLITADSKSNFELRGNTFTSKIFFGFVNWFGHLISDVSGSSNSKGRGMGIPSPLWTWTNDVIAIKGSMNIPVNKFDKYFNELALNIYEKGFDARFQTTQVIPVLINEFIVRFFYTLRRLLNYLKSIGEEKFDFSQMWKECEPFSNATVKRMLTVAHGTFCLLDVSDVIVRGIKNKNVVEMAMRLNVAGIGRFSVSLLGEGYRKIKIRSNQKKITETKKEYQLVNDYLNGLHELADIYNDTNYLGLIEDFKSSEVYKEAFEKSALIADKRKVDKDKILKNKDDIDNYFSNKDKKKKVKNEKSDLQIVIEELNKTIENLGENDSQLYEELDSAINFVNNIKNVPNDKKEKFEQANSYKILWKKQVEKIEEDYRKNTITDASTGVATAGFGIAVAAMGPTIAMGTATTFGIASTGTAISALSGAAQTSAALAWLGGGSIAAGGGGIATGSFILSLAGPIGWTIAGTALTTSSLLLVKNKIDKKRLTKIMNQISERDINSTKLAIVEIKERIARIKEDKKSLKEAMERIRTFDTDYNNLDESQQYEVGAYINLMLASTQLLINPIKGLTPNYSEKDYEIFSLNKNDTIKNNKDLIVSLCNFLYNIPLTDKEKKLFYKQLRNDKNLLKSFNISKKDFTEELFNSIFDALENNIKKSTD